MYIGQIGEKITVEVTMKSIHEFKNYAFGYSGTSNYLYKMQDEQGNDYIWKTTTFMTVDSGESNCYGDPLPYAIAKNDKIRINATVKAHSEYHGTKQTLLTRVKVELLKKATTKEERVTKKQEEQLATLRGDDFIWKIPYHQYKEHYSDCETLYGSYDSDSATISVIIRQGRLKNSGVRGMHFSGYQFENKDGQRITYRAVNEENAYKRVQNDYPDHDWKCVRIFR